MTIRALCVMKNEGDVIEETLRDALRWCDRVYVLDNGSDDGGWERVRGLSLVEPRIVAHGRDERPFTDDIRAQLYTAYAPEAREGDWWCRLDADELYVGDPREVLAATRAEHFSVWSASLSFYFTDMDAARYAADPVAFADDVSVLEKCRFYLNHWSEPRFFRHSAGVRWREGDGGYPTAVWTRPASPTRVLLRHFPYRSPAQIQRRLDARAAGAEFAHENVGGWAQAVAGIRDTGRFVAQPGDGRAATWLDRVVAASALDYDAHDGGFVVNEALMPPIHTPQPAPQRWGASARRLVRRVRTGAR